MVTNFEHLASQKDMYDKMIFVEDMLVDGESKEEYVQAMSAMRGVLDIMMKDWVRAAGLSDATIIAYMNEKFTDKSNSVNLFGRIYALERIGAISGNTASVLHDIRKIGNDAAHLGDEVLSMSKDMAYNKAVTMYTEVYNTTYEYLSYVQSKAGAADSNAAGVNTGYQYKNSTINSTISGMSFMQTQAYKKLFGSVKMLPLVSIIFAIVALLSLILIPVNQTLGVSLISIFGSMAVGTIIGTSIVTTRSKESVTQIVLLMTDEQAEKASMWTNQQAKAFLNSLDLYMQSKNMTGQYMSPMGQMIIKEYINLSF